MVFDLNPFKPDTLFSTAKNRESRKMPPLQKFLTLKNGLFLGRYECIPSSSTQMASRAAATCHLPQE